MKTIIVILAFLMCSAEAQTVRTVSRLDTLTAAWTPLYLSYIPRDFKLVVSSTNQTADIRVAFSRGDTGAIMHDRILTIVANNKGTGYHPGDTLTLDSGTNGKIRLTDTTGNGLVNNFTRLDNGYGYPTDTVAASGGSGSAATFDITTDDGSFGGILLPFNSGSFAIFNIDNIPKSVDTVWVKTANSTILYLSKW